MSAKPEIAKNGTRTTRAFTGVPTGRIEATRRASRAAAAGPEASISSRSAAKYGLRPAKEVKSGSGVPAMAETSLP